MPVFTCLSPAVIPFSLLEHLFNQPPWPQRCYYLTARGTTAPAGQIIWGALITSNKCPHAIGIVSNNEGTYVIIRCYLIAVLARV